MQQIDPTNASLPHAAPRRIHRSRVRRFVLVYYVFFALVLLALVPPYISVNRYQRRIASSISQSLGRPVHLDSVTLNLLPLPGFTLNNFVVSEDPTFGTEPVIRANTVHATLRLSSLWTRRVEFSTISFTDPSINLVHLADGQWNLETILTQAARIEAAPTAQKSAGPAPRFPYIEATGARLNLKLDQEKTPLSLTDANFALWLPNPQEWHLRLEAHPARTDSNVSDTGTLEIEGTLGRAASLSQVAIAMQADWRNAPLGEASRLLLNHDAGLRGDLTLSAKVHGTVGKSRIETRLILTAGRRADFVPQHPLSLDMQCLGSASNAFHSFSDISCNWPPAGSSATPTLTVAATLADVRNPISTTVDIASPGIPAQTILDWAQIASARFPQTTSATGTVTGNLQYRPNSASEAPWTGIIHISDLALQSAGLGSAPLLIGSATVQSATVSPPTRNRRHFHGVPTPTGNVFQISPVSLPLGGKEPATLDGRIDSAGYTLHLTGMIVFSRLIALATAIPQLGDGLKDVTPANVAATPVRIDISAVRPWGGQQTWQDTLVRTSTTARSRRPAH